MSGETSPEGLTENVQTAKRTRAKEAVVFATITGVSIMLGFGLTISMAKKKDPKYFLKGMVDKQDLHDSGGSLAVKALGWGTLYSVGGFGLLCFGVCKLMGVSSLDEFRQKVQRKLPKVSTKEQEERLEFDTLKDLADYLVNEDEKAKRASPKR